VRMPVFHRAKRGLLLFGALLLSSILFAACGENSPSILDTAGPIASSESGVFWAIFVIATIVFVGVEGALLFSIVRYRERPGMPNPRQIHGSMKLEILWTAIPSALLIVILVFTIRGLLDVAPEAEPADSNKVEVVAIGHQWWWEFQYPQYNFTTADSLVVPTNTVVHVKLFSNNVIHSFWVPQITGKTDVVPGHDNTKWFKVDKTGTFEGSCTEYCGLQHANMRFNVVAQDFNGYMSWVHSQQQVAATPASSTDKYSASNGQKVFEANCTSCHGIVGVNKKAYDDTASKVCAVNSPPAASCPLGPNLTHFGSRGLIAGGVLDNNKTECNPSDPQLFEKCNLAKWLQNTQAIKPGNAMVVSLSAEQIRNLVAYLESLK
jgi:cytochrome c oxidase subunit 2